MENDHFIYLLFHYISTTVVVMLFFVLYNPNKFLECVLELNV